ncbi:MAG: Lacal_2735 family protein [Bacteroidota bacterium]
MIKFFRQNKVETLKRKYDKIMKEAYDLSKSNPDASLIKQKEAQEIQRKIVGMPL